MSLENVTSEMRNQMAKLRVWDGQISNQKYKQAISEGVLGDSLLDKLAKGEEAVFTPKQIFEMTGIKQDTVYGWIHGGLLPNTSRIGGSYMVLKSDFDALFEQSKMAHLTSEKK